MAGVSLSLTAEGALLVLVEDVKGLHRGVVQPEHLRGFAAKVVALSELARSLERPETAQVS